MDGLDRPSIDSSSYLSKSGTSSVKSATAIKGMQLGAKGAKNKWEEALVKEDKLAPFVDLSSRPSAPETISQPVAAVVQQPIMLQVVEKICAKLTRDGMVESFEIKGSLTLTANNEDVSKCAVVMAVGNVSLFTFVTHPKINKPLYDKSGVLQLKEASKGFPVSRPLGILRWSYSSTADDLVPLKINCWPEEESRGQMNVSIEYSMDQDKLELVDVQIRIPLGTSDSPNILNADGRYKHNAQAQELVWELDLIDSSNSSGTLEFNVSQRNADAFFPITAQFASKKLFCNIDVTGVKAVEGGGPLQYGISKGLSTEEYTIE
eukprot:gene965-1089_t